MTPALNVQSGGPFTTVQDLGRYGGQALGIPVCGALDPDALRIANALVGNPSGCAGLEIRFLGPTLQVDAESVRVALVGTSAPITIDGSEQTSLPAGRSVTLERGTVFSIGPLRDSATAYLGVSGGFDLPYVFGSQSTFTPAGFGGLQGKAIAAGDKLPLTLDRVPPGQDLEVPAPLTHDRSRPIRVVLGPQDDYFTEEAIETFLHRPYKVDARSNRMAMRLEGPELAHVSEYNIPSDGIVTGAIQVPGHGLPIILLADRQTTGGYPKIATIISRDLPLLASAMPGDDLQFQAVAPEEAEKLHREREIELTAMLDGLVPAGTSHGDIERRLREHNLISGVVDG